MKNSKPGNGDSHPKQALAAGVTAPDFKLPTTPDQCVSLSEFRGAPLILMFYPADWSPVCGDQVVLYNELLPEFRNHRASILGISVDGVWCHLAFAKDRKLRYPLLADFEPKGGVAREAEFTAHEGAFLRALFVVDGGGTIRWSYVSPIGINPGADGILSALENLDSQAAGQNRDQNQEKEHGHRFHSETRAAGQRA